MTTQVIIENIEGNAVLVQKVESQVDRSVIHATTTLRPGNKTTMFVHGEVVIRVTELSRA